ncbi:hypothetical protein P9G84_16480 [Brevibacillus centrosporus]|uniref:hypothetical protein n=1 Tax=Brevibacillus centrosporus TaxID=54910 RepID=UPI000F0A08CD|nr:hypothetical protein [Brevibacillus centrosporus]MEC2130531.1 hypothetical protein [Brevibacillus centrosporus]RNB68867.1 hypothetical protein EDM55_15760 [Brevibacillus centrosporus]GED34937.1 hypothetical protein BCE02nite_60780 [Brevibacillus centrosporus]
MTKRNHSMTTHIHLHIHTNQDGGQPTLEVQKPDQVFRLDHGQKGQPFLEFDQMWESGMYEDLETVSDPQVVSPEEMNEVLDYYKKHYRYSIEVHFMDYKGQELDTFSYEQYQARVGEINEGEEGNNDHSLFRPESPTTYIWGRSGKLRMTQKRGFGQLRPV